MKEFWQKLIGNGAIVLLIVAVLYILFLRECKKQPPCPAEDEKIVKKADWQSMIDAANKPPIIHIDTIYLKGDPVLIPGIPVSDITDNDPVDSIYNYSDSLVQKDIDVRYHFITEGKLLAKEWEYKPIVTTIHRTDSIPYPVPVEVQVISKVSQRGLYGYGIAGGNGQSFLWGGGLDFITKKNTDIGYLYQRYGTENFHSVKVGIKLFQK